MYVINLTNTLKIKETIDHKKLILFPVQKSRSFLRAEKWVACPVECEKLPAVFHRFSHSPFFALGKFTADFEDDVPHNASTKCTGNYCLRVSIESLFRFVKSLFRLEAFP